MSKSSVSNEEPGTTAVSICREFTESTTLHGIQNVFKKSSKKERIIWLFCLLVAAAAYLKFTQILISSFFSYDVITHITVVNQDAANFPAVTICNFNPFRREYSEQTKLSKLMSIFPEKSLSEADFFALGNFTETSMEKIYRDGAHKLGEMLYLCEFRGKNCHAQNFTPVVTRLGLCYTFNKDFSFMKIENPGVEFGLKLHLSPQQDLYYGFAAEIAGFKVHIHNQDEPPLIKENGFAVMPGTSTFVAVTIKQVRSLPPPYKSKCANKKIFGTSVYSKPLCFEECRTRFIISKCHCRSAEMQVIQNVPVCILKQHVFCVRKKEIEFANKHSRNCSCPTPCDVTSYKTRFSYAQYPSEYAKQSAANHLGKLSGRHNYSEFGTNYLKRYERGDMVELKIFYQDLNYNLIEEVPKYQIENLLAEAGGMMGLLLGASVITVIEFLDFIISLLALKFYKVSSRSPPDQ